MRGGYAKRWMAGAFETAAADAFGTQAAEPRERLRRLLADNGGCLQASDRVTLTATLSNVRVAALEAAFQQDAQRRTDCLK